MSNWAYPVVPVVVTDKFGMRMHPIYHEMRLHRGTDYRCSYGQTVRAAAGGEVIWAGYNGGEGNSFHVRHDDGTITKSFHNSTLDVSRGQRVTKLQRGAGAGTTGDSTGVHCHFEVHIGRDGNVVDADAFLRSQGADTDGSSTAGGGSTPIDNTPAPEPVILNRKEFNMDKCLIQFADAGTIILWDLRDGKDGKRAQHVQNVLDAQRLIGIYGPVARFDSQGEWEIIRSRYGLGN